MKDVKTLNNKIKIDISEDEQEEIDHPDLDELTENPRNESLLKFLRTKIHTEEVKNKLGQLNNLPITLVRLVQTAHSKMSELSRKNCSLPDLIGRVKASVRQLLE